MLQTNHTVYVANDKRLRYKRIGRWRDPSAGSSTARAAAPPCGALCTPRKGLLRPEATPLPRLTALATQNRLARAVTLVRCQLHEPPDRAFLIRFAPSLLPAFEGAERYAQKLSGLLPGPSESKPPSAEVVGEGHSTSTALSWLG